MIVELESQLQKINTIKDDLDLMRYTKNLIKNLIPELQPPTQPLTENQKESKRRHGCGTTRNHGLRKSYNSYCLVPSGIPSSDRAKILGQSIETNEKYYTFERLDYCDIAREKILNARKAEQKDNQNED